MSKIISIKEQGFRANASGYSSSYVGYVVALDDGAVYQMGIQDGQSCCENYGYLTSQDDFTDFIGADLLSVAMVDDQLKHYDVSSVYDGAAMFVNVDTSVGLLQFVAYNEHNGYYSHNAVLVQNSIVTYSEYL